MIPCRRHDARGYQGSPPAVNTVFAGFFSTFFNSDITYKRKKRCVNSYNYFSFLVWYSESSFHFVSFRCRLCPFSIRHCLQVFGSTFPDCRWNSEAMRRLCSQCQMVIIHVVSCRYASSLHSKQALTRCIEELDVPVLLGVLPTCLLRHVPHQAALKYNFQNPFFSSTS